MPSVLILDDNLLVRVGLKQLLAHEFRGMVFGEAKSGEKAALRLASRLWNLVVINISVPGKDPFQMLQEIHAAYPSVRVLMLSANADPRYAMRAKRLRASGYVSTNSTRAQLLKAFHDVLSGKEHFSTSSRLGREGRNTPRSTDLSTLERGIMWACVAGTRMKKIAAELNLSVKTVSTYKRRLLNKLQLNSIAELVRYAIDHKDALGPVYEPLAHTVPPRSPAESTGAE